MSLQSELENLKLRSQQLIMISFTSKQLQTQLCEGNTFHLPALAGTLPMQRKCTTKQFQK